MYVSFNNTVQKRNILMGFTHESKQRKAKVIHQRTQFRVTLLRGACFDCFFFILNQRNTFKQEMFCVFIEKDDSASGFPVNISVVLGIAVLFVLLIVALLIVLKRWVYYFFILLTILLVSNIWMIFVTLRLSHVFVVFTRKLVEKKKLSQNGSNNLRVSEFRNENAVYANESKSVHENVVFKIVYYTTRCL